MGGVLALILMVRATNSSSFSFPVQKHHTLGHFSLKRRYGDNQTELSATGKSQREIEKATRLHKQVQ